MKCMYRFLMVFWLIFPVMTLQGQEQPSTDQLREEIRRICRGLEPTGVAVAIVKDGQTKMTYTYGQASEASGAELTQSSLFNIASCSKAFTAASVAMLVQEGKLSWGDPVTEYIPELKLKDPYITRNLNIVDILSHRSGLSTFTGDLLWYHTDYSNEQIIKRMKYLPIENDFRSDFGYQNNMYMLAGEIVERVTGKTWSQFVNERIFTPLEMEASVPSPSELEADAHLAYPHYKDQQMEVYEFNGTKPAASIYSNIEEMAHWMGMWLNQGKWQGQSLLQPDRVNRCMAPQTLLNVSESERQQGTHFKAYGLGWSMYDYHGLKVVEHGGGMPGYLSKVTMVPEAGLGVVILNNGFDLFIRQTINQTIMAHYLGEVPSKDRLQQALDARKNYRARQEKARQKRLNQRVSNTRSSLDLKAYTGNYRDRFYGEARIDLQNDSLRLTLLPAGETFTSKMSHWHYDTFRVDFNDPFLPFGLVTFEFNAKGEVSGFQINLPSQDFHFDNLHFIKQASR